MKKNEEYNSNVCGLGNLFKFHPLRKRNNIRINLLLLINKTGAPNVWVVAHVLISRFSNVNHKSFSEIKTKIILNLTEFSCLVSSNVGLAFQPYNYLQNW